MMSKSTMRFGAWFFARLRAASKTVRAPKSAAAFESVGTTVEATVTSGGGAFGSTAEFAKRRNHHRLSMRETIREYIEGFIAGKDPLWVQGGTAKQLAALLKRASRAKLCKRPAPDKWSVSEIVAHLADAEIVIGWRVRSILGSPGLPIQAFDKDAWVTAGHYDKRSPQKSLELFRVVREANLALYKTLSSEQWKHYGVHSERREESVERILFFIAGHDLNHLAQIETILRNKGRSKRGLP